MTKPRFHITISKYPTLKSPYKWNASCNDCAGKNNSRHYWFSSWALAAYEMSIHYEYHMRGTI